MPTPPTWWPDAVALAEQGLGTGTIAIRLNRTPSTVRKALGAMSRDKRCRVCDTPVRASRWLLCAKHAHADGYCQCPQCEGRRGGKPSGKPIPRRPDAWVRPSAFGKASRDGSTVYADTDADAERFLSQFLACVADFSRGRAA